MNCCILITIIVGILSLLLGYLIGRLTRGTSKNVLTYKKRIQKLESDLVACKYKKPTSKKTKKDTVVIHKKGSNTTNSKIKKKIEKTSVLKDAKAIPVSPLLEKKVVDSNSKVASVKVVPNKKNKQDKTKTKETLTVSNGNNKSTYFLYAIIVCIVGATFNYFLCDCLENNLNNKNIDTNFSSVKAVPTSSKSTLKNDKLPSKNINLVVDSSKVAKLKTIQPIKKELKLPKAKVVNDSLKNSDTNIKDKKYFFNFKIGESYTNLKYSQRKKLNEIYKIVKGSRLKVLVIGHTDSFGKSYSNKVLGKKRANCLKSYLLSLGLSNKQVIAISKGESEPIATNNTEEGRIKNRRIEIKFK